MDTLLKEKIFARLYGRSNTIRRKSGNRNLHNNSKSNLIYKSVSNPCYMLITSCRD